MAHVSLTEPALVPQHSEVASCCFTFQRRQEEKFAEKPAAHFLCFWRELCCCTEEELMTLEMELLLYAPVTAETYCHLVLYQTWLITAKMFLIDSIVCFFPEVVFSHVFLCLSDASELKPEGKLFHTFRNSFQTKTQFPYWFSATLPRWSCSQHKIFPNCYLWRC